MSPTSPVRLVVFDLDGTLIDSLRDLAESANALLGECGAAPLAHEAIGRMVGDGAATLVARAFEAAGLDQPADALERYIALYNTRLLTWTRPYEGVDALLTGLARRVSLAVLTNKPIGPTRRILDGLGLARHFAADRVLGGDGPHARKPDPDGLLRLAASGKVPVEQTLLVGDSPVDAETARAAGVRLCVARYGFGFRSSHDQSPPPAIHIDRPLDLLERL